ncbi:MAG: hypothetical protein ACI9ES_003565 [Oceanospirillaceae bacterium]|jgi:hypothetical protein
MLLWKHRIMKYNLLILTLTLSLSVSAEASVFSGSWRIDPIPNSTQSFELHISQNGDNICGIHFGSARGGAKIDSSFGSEPKATISGTVTEGATEVTIISSQSEKPIEGIIALQQGVLVWNVINPQMHRIMTIPKSAQLKLIAPVDLGYRNLGVLCGL